MSASDDAEGGGNEDRDGRTASQSFRELFAVSRSYAIGTFGSTALRYSVLPVVTRLLGATEFGLVALGIAYTSLANVLTNAGIPAAVFRYYGSSSSQDERVEVVRAGFTAALALVLVLVVVSVLTDEVVAVLVFGDSGRWRLVRLLGAYVFVMTVVDYTKVVLRATVEPRLYNYVTIGEALLQTVLALVIIGFVSDTAYGYWMGYVVGTCLVMAPAVYRIRGWVWGMSSLGRVKQVLSFGSRLLPGTLAFWALNVADRRIIQGLLGTAMLGIYEVGYKIGRSVELVSRPVQAAWPRFAFSGANNKEVGENVTVGLRFGIAALGAVSLTLTAASPLLVRIAGPESFMPGAVVVGPVALAHMVVGLRPVLTTGIKWAEKPELESMCAGAAVVVNIVLLLTLSEPLGLLGCALASLVAFWLFGGGVLLFSNRSLAETDLLGAVGKPVAILLGCWGVLLAAFESFTGGPARLLTYAVVMAVYGFLIYRTGTITVREARTVLRWLRFGDDA